MKIAAGRIIIFGLAQRTSPPKRPMEQGDAFKLPWSQEHQFRDPREALWSMQSWFMISTSVRNLYRHLLHNDVEHGPLMQPDTVNGGMTSRTS
jgi:hypothetical protein